MRALNELIWLRKVISIICCEHGNEPLSDINLANLTGCYLFVSHHVIATNVTVLSTETISQFMQSRNRILKNKIVCFDSSVFSRET